jgi:hypothetical protein
MKVSFRVIIFGAISTSILTSLLLSGHYKLLPVAFACALGGMFLVIRSGQQTRALSGSDRRLGGRLLFLGSLLIFSSITTLAVRWVEMTVIERLLSAAAFLSGIVLLRTGIRLGKKTQGNVG